MEKPLSPEEFLRNYDPDLTNREIKEIVTLYRDSHQILNQMQRLLATETPFKGLIMLLDCYGKNSSYTGAISRAFIAGTLFRVPLRGSEHRDIEKECKKIETLIRRLSRNGEEAPLCECGCGLAVKRSTRPHHNWNRFLNGHTGKWASETFVKGKTRKEACPKGHPYSEENTYRRVNPSTGAVRFATCKICARNNYAAYQPTEEQREKKREYARNYYAQNRDKLLERQAQRRALSKDEAK